MTKAFNLFEKINEIFSDDKNLQQQICYENNRLYKVRNIKLTTFLTRVKAEIFSTRIKLILQIKPFEYITY